MNYFTKINEKIQELTKDFCGCESEHDCNGCSCNKIIRREGQLNGFYVCDLLFTIADDLLSQEE